MSHPNTQVITTQTSKLANLKVRLTNSRLLKKGILKLARLFPDLKRLLHRFHGGVFLTYHKEFSAHHPIHPPFIPEILVLPLQQHVGQAPKPIVNIGDKVLKNQKIADLNKSKDKTLTTPIHAPTSGTIIAIEKRTLPHPSGLKETCILIQPDGKDQAIENALNADGTWPDTPEKLKQTVQQAGIVGMGGAGFPTYAKIPQQKGKIHTLIINGAECEPYITCDDLLMQTQPLQILTGSLIVAKALGAQKILCGIEDNKRQAINSMQKMAQQLQPKLQALNLTLDIIPVPTVYPMGGQKQLTYQLTGIEMPSKTHAIDLGILMMNVATYAAIEDAVEHGNPLTRRLVTITGEGIQNAFNIPALLGTPFNSLVALAKPKHPLNTPLIMGGPMMGFEVKDNQVPVIKTTNCILVHKPYIPETVLPCIRCGECMDVCPIYLLPQQLYWYSRSEEWDKVEQHHIRDCIECGCCSYVCPSNIPLVQYYRHAKSEIKRKKEAERLAEKAKLRHEQRLARLEKEKQEREARIKAKKAAIKQKAQAEKAEKPSKDAQPLKEQPKTALSARERAIQAAKARAAAKKATGDKNPSNPTAATTTKENPNLESSNTTLEKKRKAAMAAAKARAAAKKAAQTKSNEKNTQKNAKIPSPDGNEATENPKTTASLQNTPHATSSKKETAKERAIAAARARAKALQKNKAKQTAASQSAPPPSNQDS